jgi:hypothetical protein
MPRAVGVHGIIRVLMMSFHRLDAKELELISELARKGPHQLIELAAFAAVAADRHERSQERVNEEI